VLSVHAKSVVEASRIAATHHAREEFPRLATAFDHIASIDSQSLDRAF
jgi:hypothetical protein